MSLPSESSPRCCWKSPARSAARLALRALLVASSVLLLAVTPTRGAPAEDLSAGGPSGVVTGSETGELEHMERELARQQRMLRRLQHGETLENTDLAPLDALPEPEGGADADPRVAPAAPIDRPLPVAIFDQRTVTIAAGTWGNSRRLELIERSLDADGDGLPELVRWVDTDRELLVRQEEDRNFNGRIDAWSDYDGGQLVARALDRNEDASPDVWEGYADGRMTRRESDRDFDGVRDSFYEYRNGWLHEERHDADNDGRIDLRVYYSGRYRARSEEDRDKDGRMDTWRWWHVVDGDELIARIELDGKRRGYADTFETYEAIDGRAVLARRDEDVDGDGEIDIASYYRGGKLVRREILAPDKANL